MDKDSIIIILIILLVVMSLFAMKMRSLCYKALNKLDEYIRLLYWYGHDDVFKS